MTIANVDSLCRERARKMRWVPCLALPVLVDRSSPVFSCLFFFPNYLTHRRTLLSTERRGARGGVELNGMREGKTRTAGEIKRQPAADQTAS